MMKVKLLKASETDITIGLPDGTEKVIPGGNVICMWCQPRDVPAWLKGERPDIDIGAALHDDGQVTLAATALWI
jgi:hypothetical protein